MAIEPFNGWDNRRSLTLAAAIEQGSAHPLAHAIRARAQEDDNGQTLPQPEQFCTLCGLGVSARLAGQQVLLGNDALLTQQGVDTPGGRRTATLLDATGRHAGIAGRGRSTGGAVRGA